MILDVVEAYMEQYGWKDDVNERGIVQFEGTFVEFNEYFIVCYNFVFCNFYSSMVLYLLINDKMMLIKMMTMKT